MGNEKIKLLQIKINEEEHINLKVKAAKRGLSIKDYILMCCLGKTEKD